MYLKSHGNGLLEVITGPMFSGKTEELLKRIKILEIADIKTLVVKPQFDTRFSENKLVSRTGGKIKAHNISKAKDILTLWNHTYKAVAIDEVNFLDKGLLKVIDKLVLNGVRVICSGLDMDFLRRPFGIMPQILSIADEVVKLKAVCVKCKTSAGFSFRKVKSTDLNLLGDSEYEARCRICHISGELEKEELLKNNKEK
ncbi:thymidine kinase [Mycoplasmopsis columbina]|uniref:Thymidine kinase n=1 Tax=Mycoplasmopsis columbina SF7 TaxID=1037410 RepID=F9UKN5_9BACT|nr:thymidine kinase [Mycoplasmopsis columbina]EGV00240.1 thymidine kinase [Mycoplasmopsis columbina SF7]VEU77129.1 thymidine kinase [Mycoplasmopsis columbina]